MKKIFKRSTLLLLCIFIFSGVLIDAKILPNKEQITVEILYNVNGDEFADNIIFEDGTKLSDYDYKVEYKPMLLSDEIGTYFNYAAWIIRDGVVSLSLDPINDVRTKSSYRDKAWNIISSENDGFVGSSYWNNTEVMKWQFNCHYSFAKSKDYWNLEPERVASNYLEVVLAKCNP